MRVGADAAERGEGACTSSTWSDTSSVQLTFDPAGTAPHRPVPEPRQGLPSTPMKRAWTSLLGITLLAATAACSHPDGDQRDALREAIDGTSTTNETAPCATCGSTTTTPTNVGTATGSDNTEHPPPNDVQLGECVLDGQFGPSATGTLTNPTSELSSYIISVNFTDAAGVIVASALGLANNIPSGATSTWEAETFDPDVAAVNCDVVKVDRYSAE